MQLGSLYFGVAFPLQLVSLRQTNAQHGSIGAYRCNGALDFLACECFSPLKVSLSMIKMTSFCFLMVHEGKPILRLAMTLVVMILDDQSVTRHVLLSLRLAWNLNRGGTKKYQVLGTVHSGTPPKVNCTEWYYAMEKRHLFLS